MAYQIMAFPMILSDRQRHSRIAIFFKWHAFLYSCAAVDKISSDSASRGTSAIAELPVSVNCIG